MGLTMEGDIDDVVFNSFMQSLLQAKARDIYRSKGLLSIHGQGNMKFVFQGVHEQMNFGPSQDEWKEGVRPYPSESKPLSVMYICPSSRCMRASGGRAAANNWTIVSMEGSIERSSTAEC